MTEHAGLLQAIRDAPEDDTPRLVYADWLDEQGEALRAEWIRLSCRLAHFCVGSEGESPQPFTSDDLRPECGEGLLAPFLSLGLTLFDRHTGHTGCRFYFHHGLVEAIHAHGAEAAERVADCFEELCRRTPLRHLILVPGHDYQTHYARTDSRTLRLLRTLVQSPSIGQLDTLGFSWYLLTDAAGRALVESPHLRPEMSLQLTGQRFTPQVRGAIIARFGERVALDDDIPF